MSEGNIKSNNSNNNNNNIMHSHVGLHGTKKSTDKQDIVPTSASWPKMVDIAYSNAMSVVNTTCARIYLCIYSTKSSSGLCDE